MTSRASAPAMTASSAQTDRFVHERLPGADQWPQLLYDAPELQIAAQANLVAELLVRASQQGWSARPFLRSEHITLSYVEAGERIRRISQVLTEDYGLVPGNRVLLRGGNSVNMALAWLGVVHAGLVAVTTMPLLRAKEIAEVIHKAEPVLALCDGKLLAELELAQAQQPQLKALITFNQPGNPAALEALATAKNGLTAACPTSADDIAILAFTSGA